ncbi:MAG: LysE family transporter [Bacteroidales bacterium]|jgi:threonine/homoserine/homoserine lactone efflux protein|nr:LysE family transporter [Bacteroidales bacterium]MBO7529702.1 LysE family transporter [Bacteroidales bacterium]
MVFVHGAIMGLTLATIFGIGPAFFLLIQTSISKGFKTALMFDLGVLFSDVIVVFLMMMTSVQIKLDDGGNMVIAGITAGLIILCFGIFTFYTKPEKIVERSAKKSAELEEVEKRLDERFDKIDEKLDVKRVGPRWYVYVAKGFIMNVFNPFIWVFWMTSVATVSGSEVYNGNKYLVTLFFLGTFTTVLAFDIVKIVGAYSLKRFFTERRMKFLNQCTGLVLALCGLMLIIRVIFFRT